MTKSVGGLARKILLLQLIAIIVIIVAFALSGTFVIDFSNKLVGSIMFIVYIVLMVIIFITCIFQIITGSREGSTISVVSGIFGIIPFTVLIAFILNIIIAFSKK